MSLLKLKSINPSYGTVQVGTHTYPWVRIGNQAWTTMNLREPVSSGRYYSRSTWGDSSCSTWAAGMNRTMDEYFGYYYYNDAVASINSMCPQGWRVPTVSDANKLLAYTGAGTSAAGLRATSGWFNDANGTDAYGFCAYAVGNFYYGASCNNPSQWNNQQIILYDSNVLGIGATSASIYSGTYGYTCRLVMDIGDTSQSKFIYLNNMERLQEDCKTLFADAGRNMVSSVSLGTGEILSDSIGNSAFHYTTQSAASVGYYAGLALDFTKTPVITFETRIKRGNAISGNYCTEVGISNVVKFECNTWTNENLRIQIHGIESTGNVTYYNSAGMHDYVGTILYVNSGVSQDNFVHCAYVYDSASGIFSIYLNGILKVRGTAALPKTESRHILIGRETNALDIYVDFISLREGDHSNNGTSFTVPTEKYTSQRLNALYYTLDGVKYPYRTIGNLQWTTLNLKYPTTNSIWYDNDSGYETSKFGRLYQPSVDFPEINEVLTDGWRIPSFTDLEDLYNATNSYGNQALALTDESSGGTNASGFSALYCGYRNTSGQFTNKDSATCIWSTTPYGDESNKDMVISSNSVSLTDSSRTSTQTRLSVRLCRGPYTDIVFLKDWVNSYGLQQSSGSNPTTIHYDESGPLDVTGTGLSGTPYVLNSEINELNWTQNDVVSLQTTGQFSFEIWCRYLTVSSSNSPIAFFYSPESNLWSEGFSIRQAAPTHATAWINDDAPATYSVSDFSQWHHYAVSCDSNKHTRFFIDGTLIHTSTRTPSRYPQFTICNKWSGRGLLAYAQPVMWKTCKWISGFTPKTKLLATDMQR